MTRPSNLDVVQEHLVFMQGEVNVKVFYPSPNEPNYIVSLDDGKFVWKCSSFSQAFDLAARLFNASDLLLESEAKDERTRIDFGAIFIIFLVLIAIKAIFDLVKGP